MLLEVFIVDAVQQAVGRRLLVKALVSWRGDPKLR